MSIHGNYDSENIFAKILRGEMPCVKVYEDEHTLAFMDVFPQNKGHTLVIPKNVQARNLLELEATAIAPLMLTTQKIARAIDAALSPDGIVVTQFNGTPAGQTVFHLHMHVIPRYENIDLGEHATGGMADMNELTSLAEQIKAHV